MGYVMVTLLSLVLGYSVGAGSVLRDVRSGRVVHRGRVYFCKDTGPLVR